MGIAGRPLVYTTPPTGEDAEATPSMSPADENTQVPRRVRGIGGARAQGGISGRPPQAQLVTYDAEAGEASSMTHGSEHPGIVHHGRGWIDGLSPPPRQAEYVVSGAGLGDAPENREPRYIRRWWLRALGSGFQPDVMSASYDPGWDKPPLPRWARFTKIFTMRREYGAHAQRFTGLHTVVLGGARMREAKMVPAMRSRLTVRSTPSTFGSTTEVIDGA